MSGQLRPCSVTFLIAFWFRGVLCAVKSDAEVNRLRGHGPVRPQAPMKIVSGHYFGLNFRDDPFAVNIWAKGKADIVENLDPAAPFDRLDKPYWPIDLNPKDPRLSGAAPVEPRQTSADIGYTKPDYVDPYLHPKPFPDAEEEATAQKIRDSIIVPIGERTVVAHEDRLRDPRFPLMPLAMYPLVAPADRITPGPYAQAPIDRIPKEYDRFASQSLRRTASRVEQKTLLNLFKRVDQDTDNAISSEEFKAEVQDHQGKSAEQEQVLWNQYHITPDPDMTKDEFLKVAATGFDLDKEFVPRKDIVLTLNSPLAPGQGYWGGGAGCPNGTFIIGAQLKVKPNSPDSGDNTALNSVNFKCSDGSVLNTVQGPDGDWTEWAECEQGQTVHSVSVRVQAYTAGLDNTGINDLRFECRSADHSKSTTLMFGEHTPVQEQSGYVFVNGYYVPRSQTTVDDQAVHVGKGKIASSGGWSDDLTCGVNGALCGGQGRLQNEPDQKDNMGLTSFRFFCCNLPLNCAGLCQNPAAADCHACQSKAQTTA